MNMKDFKGIIALAAVTVLAFGLIWGSSALNRSGTAEETIPSGTDERQEEMSVEGYADIRKAIRKYSDSGALSGYEVTVETRGYQGPIVMTAYFDTDVETLQQLAILEQQETENLGARIQEEEFLDQFRGMELPVYLAGSETGENSIRAESGGTKTAESSGASDESSGTAASSQAELVWSGLRDGVYQASEDTYSDGFLNTMTMTVSGGTVTEIVWDAQDDTGNTKRILSDRGEYVMTEGGLTWTQQADRLAEEVIARQSLAFLRPDQSGKTDAVAGVSISVAPFVTLTRQCLEQAGATAAAENRETVSENSMAASIQETDAEKGSPVDGISGATASSAAVINGINRAYEYLLEETGRGNEGENG